MGLSFLFTLLHAILESKTRVDSIVRGVGNPLENSGNPHRRSVQQPRTAQCAGPLQFGQRCRVHGPVVLEDTGRLRMLACRQPKPVHSISNRRDRAQKRPSLPASAAVAMATI